MTGRPFRPDRPIVLVGLMGAGKTSLGRRLAQRLGVPFADCDEEVEKETGRTIPDLFRAAGESAFRDIERRIMARLAAGPPAVVATGGGAFLDEGTRRLVLERCIAVWLKAEPETLAARVAGSDRPLLAGRDALAVLSRLAAERRPFYEQAQIHVQSGEDALEQILAALAERSRA
jgi:shikimate kinase